MIVSAGQSPAWKAAMAQKGILPPAPTWFVPQPEAATKPKAGYVSLPPLPTKRKQIKKRMPHPSDERIYDRKIGPLCFQSSWLMVARRLEAGDGRREALAYVFRRWNGYIKPIDRVVASVPVEEPVVSVEEQAVPVKEKFVPRPPIALIVYICCDFYHVSTREILGQSRSEDIVHARHVAMYLCRNLTKHSFPDIGRRMGGRDHSTIIHGVRRIEEMTITAPAIAEEVAEVERAIMAAFNAPPEPAPEPELEAA